MDTAIFATPESTHATRQVASASLLESISPAQDLLNREYEKALLLARRIPAVPLQSTENPTVILVGGPYDGQDIRITATEFGAGFFLRNGQRYLRADAESLLGTDARIPTFKWENEVLSASALDSWAAFKRPQQVEVLDCGLAV